MDKTEYVNTLGYFPKVTIIVLNWNGKQNTYECLKSLECIDYAGYNIIVVDNNSSDGSQEFLKKQFPEITLIENRDNVGFGAGFNIGIAKAVEFGADYVLCLNNDVIVDRNILKELVKIGELSNKIGGLSPMEYLFHEPNRINCAGGTIKFVGGKVFGQGELDRGQFNKIRETTLLTGPAMLLKINALLDVGFFDESFFYGPEDKDIALRLSKKGYKLLFVPWAKLWHKRRGATGGLITPINLYFHVRNYLLFIKKHANKLEMFFSVLYFGLLDFPLTVFSARCKRKNLEAIKKGIVWHLAYELIPPDSQMVELLSRKLPTQDFRVKK